MKFNKLALAAAITAAPMAGMAMEPMNDDAMSDVTGQDGLTIELGTIAAFDIRVDDADGLDGDTMTGGGAIYIDNFSMTGTTTVDIDADADTLQLGIGLGAGTINLGDISPTSLGATTPGTTVISLGSLSHSGIDMNVQLGNEDQGNMVAVSGTVTGGITLNGFSVTDASSSESISMDLQIDDQGAGTDLTLDFAVDVVGTATGGLEITGLDAVDVTLGNLTLGSTPAIGDVSIIGLTPPTVTIRGH